jgi:hypothetical protein
MGQKLLDEYERVKQCWGLKAQVRLAIITRLAAPSASKAPDSSENLALFANAIEKIAKEFENQTGEP